MAKPDFASHPASSSSSRRHKASHSDPSHRPPRSRPAPSGTRILTLLATLSATPLSALAHPLDPPETSLPFLYPPFVLQPTPASFAKRSDTVSTPVAATVTSAPSSEPSRCRHARRHLPDKFAIADDGLWHKTSWSLYGSRAVPCSATPTMKDDADVSNSGDPRDPSYDDFDISNLPTGWTSITIDATSHRGTVVVLALSVSLALFIMLMFLFIFWRRKVAKRDPEKRRRTSSNSADDISTRSIREAKAAQRKWAKAAIRWRDNLRFSAHRRRANRALAPATSYSTLAQEEAINARNSLPRSRPSSPTPIRRSVTPTPGVRSPSMTSIHSSHSRIQTPRVSTTTDLPLPPTSSLSNQPPAYDPPSSPPESHVSLENTYSNCSPSGILKPPLSSHAQPQPYGDDDGHVTSLSGHVATDDKATLSHRAALASAPSGSNSNFPQSVSVPSMEEVDTFEWPSGSPPPPSHDEYRYEPHPPYSPPTSLLPPPPSNEKQRFDYSHDLDASVSLGNAVFEPQLGPSAPPFEESEAMPSAPPLDLDAHVPSAPPMDPEDEDYPDTSISDLEDGADAGASP